MTNQLMNRLQPIALLLFYLTFGVSYSHGQDSNITKSQLDEFMINKMIETQKVFDWSELSSEQLHAALLLSDSIAVVGYQPANFKSLRTKIHLINLEDENWTLARDKMINHIVNRTNQIQEVKLKAKDLLPYGINENLPYFFIKMKDLEMIILLP